MPLPGKSGVVQRERAELALRIIALGALVLAVLRVGGIFDSAARRDSPAIVYSTGSRTPLIATLREMLTRDDGAAPLQLLATSVPGDSTRALLSSAKAVGIPVRWTDSTHGAAVALEATSLIDPKGGVMLRAASPAGVSLAFRDSVGLIDSVRTRGLGASMTIGKVAGAVQLAAGNTRATVTAPPNAIVRRVLVIANPGWEAKFTTAALEERGWTVDVRYALGRNVTVTQGAPLAADTARYAAVVVLDSSVVPHAAELRRYVNEGGGLIAAGAAGTISALDDLLPARAGALRSGVPGALATDVPLDGVSWRVLTADSNASVLMQSARAPSKSAGSAKAASGTIVARQFGSGRVVQIAYDATWQWRMAGPEGSVQAHRQWWSNIIGLVAFAPESREESAARASSPLPGNAAPYADLVARLGAPRAMPTVGAKSLSNMPWNLILLLTTVGALLLEWGSRRLRGAR